MGMTLVNNADRVEGRVPRAARECHRAIFTQKGGTVIRQSISYPFKDLSKYGRVRRFARSSARRRWKPAMATLPCCRCPPSTTDRTMRPDGDAHGIRLNIDKRATHALALDLRSFGPVSMVLWQTLSGPDLGAKNPSRIPMR
jgi:alpha-N-arabinofuranosidase